MNTTAIGESTEEVVQKLFLEHSLVVECENISVMNDKADLKYRLKNESVWRGVQIKTRDRVHGGGITKMQYPLDMVIIIVRQDRTKLWVLTWSELIQSNKQYGYFRKYMHTSINTLKVALKNYLKTSTVYAPMLSPTHIKEYSMVQYLLDLCKRNNWNFTSAENVSTVDGMFNEKRAQLKYTNTINAKHTSGGYAVSTFKRINKQSVPYEANDFDVLIVMVADCTDFVYIIPMQILINNGVIHTSAQKGKKVIYLYKPTDTVYSVRNRFYNYLLPVPPLREAGNNFLCNRCNRIVIKRNWRRHQLTKSCLQWNL